jgi:hypothetical protein
MTMSETDPRVLDDLFNIPDEVRANAFVVNMSELDQDRVNKLVNEYVVPDELKAQFGKAFGIVKDALAAGRSEASYVDGSFGAGKSHFLTVFGELLNANPVARRKPEFGSLLNEHDDWLTGNKFLQIRINMIDEESLPSALFGAYIKTVERLDQDVEFPALMRADNLLRNARDIRERVGDDRFIAELGDIDEDDEWGAVGWTAEDLDRAFAAPHGDPDRQRLVAALLTTWLSSYKDAVGGTTEAYVQFDEGLSVMSRHAESLGYDGIVLLLDELVLWLSGMVSDLARAQREAQSVSRLVEAEDWPRPIPIISFVPRQRDLQELVGRDVSGAENESLFETLDHWKARFNLIELADKHLPEIVRQRMLGAKSDAAREAIAKAFRGIQATDPRVKDVLLDSVGETGTMADFERSYPFSPVFMHVIVDVAEALQRQRSGIKLMSMLLRDYRDILPVGQLMPVGAIFGKLIDGKDEPVGKKLLHEFKAVSSFYKNQVRPWLLDRHNLTEDAATAEPTNSPFSGEDLVLKTLMLSALTPGLPALQNPTVSQLLALNHGAIDDFLPGMDTNQVLSLLRDISAEHGEFQVSEGDNPRVRLHLIGVNVNAIIDKARGNDNHGSQVHLVNKLLWEETGLSGLGDPDSVHPLKWRGTSRTVEAVFGNVRELAQGNFSPQRENALRVVIDYPFDQENRPPTDDEHRIRKIRGEIDPPSLAVCWLPTYLSAAEMDQLRELNVIAYLLERDERLVTYAGNLTTDERQQAKLQLETRHNSLRIKVVEALKGVYGLSELRNASDRPSPKQILHPMQGKLERDKPPAGTDFKTAFEWIAGHLLDSVYADHPNLDAGNSGALVTKKDLKKILDTVEAARQQDGGRLEIEAGQSAAMLRRLCNPLALATVGENFILRFEWQMRINRELGLRPDDRVTVAKIRSAIDTKLLPGLLPEVRDLIIRCYAIQDDRAWHRGGALLPPPGVDDRLAADMELITRPLPSEDEYNRALSRAVGIFGAQRWPVRTYRAVQALQNAVRLKTDETEDAVRSVRRLLAEHLGDLGMREDSPRQVTMDELDRLYADFGAAADPTEALKLLANAELTKDESVYLKCINGIKPLHQQLKATRWEVIARLHDGTPFMTGLLGELQPVAHDEEIATSLAGVLSDIEVRALKHLAAPPPTPAPSGSGQIDLPELGQDSPSGTGAYRRRVTAKGAAADLEALKSQILDEGGEWEVTARKLT